jgi:hypothetical protein
MNFGLGCREVNKKSSYELREEIEESLERKVESIYR